MNIVCDISRAEIFRRNSYMEILLYICLCEIKCRLFAFFSENGCHFSCDTVNTLAVRAVCGDRNVKNPVIHSKDRFYVCSNSGIFR